MDGGNGWPGAGEQKHWCKSIGEERGELFVAWGSSLATKQAATQRLPAGAGAALWAEHASAKRIV